MNTKRLLILPILAVLAGGCASEHVPDSLDYHPHYYFNQEFPPGDVSSRDGQHNGASPRISPAADGVESCVKSGMIGSDTKT
jgi:hypothetical protein